MSLAQQVKSSLWLIVFYALIILFSWLGSFGGLNVIGQPLGYGAGGGDVVGDLLWGRAQLPAAG